LTQISNTDSGKTITGNEIKKVFSSLYFQTVIVESSTI
jgi:hypothetical protein